MARYVVRQVTNSPLSLSRPLSLSSPEAWGSHFASQLCIFRAAPRMAHSGTQRDGGPQSDLTLVPAPVERPLLQAQPCFRSWHSWSLTLIGLLMIPFQGMKGSTQQGRSRSCAAVAEQANQPWSRVSRERERARLRGPQPCK